MGTSSKGVMCTASEMMPGPALVMACYDDVLAISFPVLIKLLEMLHSINRKEFFNNSMREYILLLS